MKNASRRLRSWELLFLMLSVDYHRITEGLLSSLTRHLWTVFFCLCAKHLSLPLKLLGQLRFRKDWQFYFNRTNLYDNGRWHFRTVYKIWTRKRIFPLRNWGKLSKHVCGLRRLVSIFTSLPPRSDIYFCPASKSMHTESARGNSRLNASSFVSSLHTLFRLRRVFKKRDFKTSWCGDRLLVIVCLFVCFHFFSFSLFTSSV